MHKQLAETLGQPHTSANNDTSADTVDYEQILNVFENLSDKDFIKYKKDGQINTLSVKAVKSLLKLYHNGDDIDNYLDDFKKTLDKEQNNNPTLLKEFKDVYNYVKNTKTSGKGLKILTPKQMLSRLPVLLTEIQAGKNSKKLKNKARQLIYSLYKSKKISKKLYNILIKKL